MQETKSDLTISELKTILTGHYKEENTSDLYHQLVSLSQDSSESAQRFLFRAIQLKDRLLLASKDEDVEQYKPELIQRKFLRSVSTGLLSESLKLHLRAALENEAITDEMLIEQLNAATLLEDERQQKLRKGSSIRVARASEVQADGKAMVSVVKQGDTDQNSNTDASAQLKNKGVREKKRAITPERRFRN